MRVGLELMKPGTAVIKTANTEDRVNNFNGVCLSLKKDILGQILLG